MNLVYKLFIQIVHSTFKYLPVFPPPLRVTNPEWSFNILACQAHPILMFVDICFHEGSFYISGKSAPSHFFVIFSCQRNSPPDRLEVWTVLSARLGDEFCWRPWSPGTRQYVSLFCSVASLGHSLRVAHKKFEFLMKKFEFSEKNLLFIR